MAKRHYVYRAKRWWVFSDRKHYFDFVAYCHGKGPEVPQPEQRYKRSLIFARYRPNH